MASWKLFFFVNFLYIKNYLHKIYDDTYNRISNTYYILNHLYNYCDIWVFIPGYDIPISLINLKNKVDILWVYDNFNNTLAYSDAKNTHKMSWLSTNIQIEDKEYAIDNFIENLSITTDEAPTLHMIYMCWCIHTKQWFKMEDVKFHIFDDNGEEIIVNLNKNPLIIKNNKLYIK